jgi:enoyl-CoA hydratase
MDKVLYEKKNRVALITLNRPDRMNSIDREMSQRLDWIWKDFNKDNDLWVAVLTGNGDNFCAGFDIGVLRQELERGHYHWDQSAMFGDYRSSPNEMNVIKPIITSVRGMVNGMGTWLMLGGDIRVSAEGAKIGLGEARLNFPVEFSAFITRHMPFSIANEMLFTAQPIDARRLYELGVINKIVPEEHLLDEAWAIAESICECGPRCIQVMKQLIMRGYDMDYCSAVNYSASMIVPLANSEETRQALSAFLEKRKPTWK